MNYVSIQEQSETSIAGGVKLIFTKDRMSVMVDLKELVVINFVMFFVSLLRLTNNN